MSRLRANDYSQPLYDSDNDFEKPKDDFTFYLQAFRIEEKKIVQHQRFEEIATKYWEVLKTSTEKDYKNTTISKDQYTYVSLIVFNELKVNEKNVQGVAAFVQRDRDGSRDTRRVAHGLKGVAHYWATNIDIEEYIDLLNKVYERIIVMKKYKNGFTGEVQPKITITFPTMEKRVLDTGGRPDKTSQQMDDWLECRSDESNRSDYDYKYEEDPDNMVVKKYKKQRALGAGQGGDSQSANATASIILKDPIIYQEDVFFDCSEYQDDWYLYPELNTVLDDILPLGYPTQVVITELKNEVFNAIEQQKAANKANFQNHSREQREGGQAPVIVDSGLKDEKGDQIEQQVIVHSKLNYFYVTLQATDIIYNNIRRQLREGQIIQLRIFSPFPKPGTRTKARATLNTTEPITELNKFGYNPALERRVHLKQLEIPQSWGPPLQTFVNIHYLVDKLEFQEYYRMDIQKVQAKDKLCLKEGDDIKKEEEFNCVETTYKRLRQIMLSKKFETIYSDRQSADNKEQKRLKKMIDKEEKRKAQAFKIGNIAQKGLSETYEEKSFIKMMKGPFYTLDSKEGLKEDDFVNCAEQDLIDAAKTSALRLLVIGKPRAGKTKLAQNLAVKLDLVHINVENWINALLNKIKAYEPPELEEGQEPPKWLTDLEDDVNQALLQGGGPSDTQVIEILRQQIQSPFAQLKGFILDLSFYNREQSWASTIRQKGLLGEPDDLGRVQEFSHIIELWCEDEDAKLRAQNMKINPDDNVVYSRWEREERKKPKPVVEGDDQVEDEENEIKPLDEQKLVQRSCDTEDKIKEELNYYNTIERPAMEELLINFYDNQYIKIESGGLTPDEITDCVVCRIKPDEDLPLRPLAIQIESANDFKSLLTEGLEENQLPRKWSLWKQIDPVALSNGKVVQGSHEFAAHYNGNVFVFSSEENMKIFITEPKQFLQERPQMPSGFRILMLGPKGVGKHTQAQLLSETYGWTIVDYKEVVRNKIQDLMKFEVHIPNNPVQGGRIGLSEQELSDVIEGKALPAWKFIPWIYDYLGYQLEKRKPPPPEEKQEDEQQEDEAPQLTEAEMKKKLQEEKKKRDEEERKRKEEEEIFRQKEDRRRRRQEAIEQGKDPLELGIEESEEEPIIIEDLSIDQLVLKTDEETGKQPFVGGFILIGYPETEEQINKLKGHGFEFDKVIFLKDSNEDDAGAEIKTRMKDVELYDWDLEQESSLKVLALCRENLNEDIVNEISCNGSKDDVFIRIRNDIDPFFVKIDNPDDVRVSADLGEEDKKLPKGDFGDYCPVTFVKDNWIVRGNPEQEVSIFGKTFWLAGEKEAEQFKFNPRQFLVTQYGDSSLPLTPPPPRIMIMGQRGAGTTTQIQMLCEKFKLDEFNLKDSYLAKLKEEKDKRKRRRLLDRGFRPPLPAEEEGMEPPPDPEIEEDPEDFDREGHEREAMKMVYDNKKGYIIDGNWRDLPEGAVGQPLQDLLFESRRVPEIVIILKCKEKTTFDRIINREQIRAEYNRLMEAREAEKKRVRDEERLTYYNEITEVKEDEEGKTPEEIQELMATWDENREQQEKEADENDPEMPNYDAMEEVEREKLREQRTNDETMFEEFAQILRDKFIIVIDDIKSDMSAEYLNIKLLDRIKDNFQFRKDLIERQLAQPLNQTEVKFFEKSYIYKHSKYGINSPLQLENPSKTKKSAVLYRERIYFLSDQEQQQKFMKEPSKYTQSVETIPLDISVKPRLVVLGLPKSGKSTLCKKLVEKTGVIHLRVSQIIEDFINKDSFQFEALSKQMKFEGRPIDDDQLVSLVVKRIQLKDCQTKGWVLEDFPKTRNQALFLAKRGIVPSNVFQLRLKGEEIYRRTDETQNDKFGHNRVILTKRIKNFEQNTPHVVSFYQRLYNNVTDIDAMKSKWSIEDKALTEISKNLQSRQSFARDYFLRERQPRACKIRNLHIDRCLLKQSLSEFSYYCPVTWKNEKLLVKCSANKEDAVLYKNMFFYFKNQKERDMFINNPARFIVNVVLPKYNDIPLRIMPHKAAEVILHEKQLNSHCPVTLIDESRVKKGDILLLIILKDQKYIFDNEFKLQRFLVNPFKYEKASLPVKMPPPEDKISLFNLQKMEDSIAFMEQALGQVVTRGLREVSENRFKHPCMSVKETMLKLFAMFLKAENPANTEYMKKKYRNKIKQFVSRCELPEELYDLAMEKGKIPVDLYFLDKKKAKGDWPEFKENYFNQRGWDYDTNKSQIASEKTDNFMSYIR